MNTYFGHPGQIYIMSFRYRGHKQKTNLCKQLQRNSSCEENYTLHLGRLNYVKKASKQLLQSNTIFVYRASTQTQISKKLTTRYYAYFNVYRPSVCVCVCVRIRLRHFRILVSKANFRSYRYQLQLQHNYRLRTLFTQCDSKCWLAWRRIFLQVFTGVGVKRY